MTEPGWGRKFLERCGVDPDDPADVEATYRSAHADHARWLTGNPQAEIDSETWDRLVEAVKDAKDWDRIPLGWPAPTLVLRTEPFRNTLRRIPKAAAE